MALLLTRHDPYHVHAALGLAVLLHFLFRVLRWHATGVGFSNRWDVVCALLHGSLPLASLFLTVPKARVTHSPMIWREFRMHSIIFSWRHVLGAVASIMVPMKLYI